MAVEGIIKKLQLGIPFTASQPPPPSIYSVNYSHGGGLAVTHDEEVKGFIPDPAKC